MSLSLEDLMEMSLSMEETVDLPIQTLSGDVFPVRIHLSDPVALFPRQFVAQYELNPYMMDRFRFYASAEWDEGTPLSGWMSVHRLKGTWRDIYQSEFKLPPRLFLVIAEDSPKDPQEKGKLIRHMVQMVYGVDEMDDMALYAEYMNWLLHSPMEETNRHDMIRAFIHECAYLFDGMMC